MSDDPDKKEREDKTKAFNRAFERKKQEHEANANVQRKRGMSPDERHIRTIDSMTQKHVDWYEKHGIRKSEESIRRDLARTAERMERKKAGE